MIEAATISPTGTKTVTLSDRQVIVAGSRSIRASRALAPRCRGWQGPTPRPARPFRLSPSARATRPGGLGILSRGRRTRRRHTPLPVPAGVGSPHSPRRVLARIDRSHAPTSPGGSSSAQQNGSKDNAWRSRVSLEHPDDSRVRSPHACAGGLTRIRRQRLTSRGNRRRRR